MKHDYVDDMVLIIMIMIIQVMMRVMMLVMMKIAICCWLPPLKALLLKKMFLQYKTLAIVLCCVLFFMKK